MKKKSLLSYIFLSVRAKSRTIVFLILANCILPIANSFSQTWDSLGAGVSGIGNGVACLGVYNNKLYVGGAFSVAGSIPASRIARWDGSQWDSVGSGTNNSGQQQCAFCNYNNELYFGGQFFNPGSPFEGMTGVPNTNRIAKWNDTNWLSVSPQYPNDNVNAVVEYNNLLYIGGNFGQIGGSPYLEIATLNGTSWNTVAGGTWGGFGGIQAFCKYNGDLIVGGGFDLAGGIPVYKIASWNGTQWDSLNGGFDGRVQSLAVDTVNNILYAGGYFLNAYNNGVPVSVNGVAKWDGTQWTAVGNNTGSQFWAMNALALEMYHGELFVGRVGSTFSQTDTIIARWNGWQWYRVPGPENTVQALKVWNDTLYVGGFFLVCSTLTVNHIAKYYAPPDPTLAVNNIPNQNLQFSIFPNPSTGEVTIATTQEGTFTATITNSQGKELLRKNFSKETKLTIPNTSKGVYIIKICNESGKLCKTEKIIIQ